MDDANEFSRAETLRDGLPVTVRSLRPDDRERVAAAVRGLDPESIYTRLFAYRRELTPEGLDRIMAVEPGRNVVLLVTRRAGPDEVVIASGRYVASAAKDGPLTAEVAFVVEEDYHGRGIAGVLLKHLAQVARANGVAALEAEVLAENKSMLAVFARSGLPMRKRREGGVVHVTLALDAAA